MHTVPSHVNFEFLDAIIFALSISFEGTTRRFNLVAMAQTHTTSTDQLDCAPGPPVPPRGHPRIRACQADVFYPFPQEADSPLVTSKVVIVVGSYV